MPLLTIFIIIPLIEIAIFMAASDEIGILNTLMLCALTALIGGALVQRQGLSTLLSGRKALEQGEIPLSEIFDGFCIVISGAMLLTPGFFTDILGFLLLLPPFRKILREKLKNSVHFQGFTSQNKSEYGMKSSDIIDAEYETVEDEKISNDDRG